MFVILDVCFDVMKFAPKDAYRNSLFIIRLCNTKQPLDNKKTARHFPIKQLRFKPFNFTELEEDEQR